MKKYFLLVVCSLILFSSLFAHNGIMTDEKNLRVTRTKWFDIIYPERSEKAAYILYENADSIYQDIAENYGYPIQYRFPVVICPAVENFNAYYSAGYYSHIVLLDTSVDDSMTVFSETLLSTFKHELTHAYTFSLYNKSTNLIRKFFGDAFVNVAESMIISSGMAESATVTEESRNGEGRLNDEFSKQQVRQAKIEKKFPDYWDVQGARNTYPTNSDYYFNAAFFEYIQNKYGMEKYASFWYRCANCENLAVGRAFKKVYKISLKQAWKDFKEHYKIPQIEANPVESGEVYDFFEHENQTYSIKNSQGSRYNQLCKSERGLYYYDITNAKVYFVPNENLNDAKIKPKALFTRSRISSLNVSSDGKYIVISYINAANVTEKSCIMIYDVDNKKTNYIEGSGYFNPVILEKNDEYYLVYKAYNSPNYELVINQLNFDDKGKISLGAKISSFTFELNKSPLFSADFGNGNILYVLKDEMDYSICVNNLQGNLIEKINAPKERMVIRYLSPVDSNKIYFSWTAPGTMPRLGCLNLQERKFELQENDVSGGVFYPVILNNSENKKSENIAYIGNFFLENRILTTDNFNLSEEIIDENTLVLADEYSNINLSSEENNLFLKNANKMPFRDYKAFKYYKRGLFLPFSSMQTTSYYENGLVQSYLLPFGITYYSNNPWNNGNIILSVGYGIEPDTMAFSVEYSGGTGSLLAATSIFDYSIKGEFEINYLGLKKTEDSLSLSSVIPFGRKSQLQTSFNSIVNYGRNDLQLDKSFVLASAVSRNLDLQLYFANQFQIGVSNVTIAEPGKYNKSGISLYTGITNLYLENTTKNDVYYNQFDLQFLGKVNIPKLLPISNKRGLCYNLPTEISARLFPNNLSAVLGDDYKWAKNVFKTGNALASIHSDTTLFAYDIQKATFLPAFYLYGIRISGSYSGMFVEKETQFTNWRFLHIKDYFELYDDDGLRYEDYLSLRATISTNLNFGSTSNLFGEIDLFGEIGYVGLFGEINEGIKYSYGISIKASM